MRRNKLRALLVAALALAVLYLAAAPTRVEPVAWTAPPAPKHEGIWAPNGKLAAVEWLARGQGAGPEAILFEAAGDLLTGYADGRVVRIKPDGAGARTIATTSGRPLGLAHAPGGGLYVADARRGLLRIAGGRVETLATEQGGRKFAFTDDLDVAADGTVYFSDASSKFGIDGFVDELIEHGANGRLLAWDPRTGRVELLAGELRFPNGVALSPSGDALLFTETGSYRVLRHWLAGPKKGVTEAFADGLPGFPDNITLSREKGRYWVALGSPRNALMDSLSGWPGLRKAVARLPAALKPKPKPHAQIVALDLDGKPVAYLDHYAKDAYFPISSVREQAGWLYLGSFSRDAIGRVRAP